MQKNDTRLIKSNLYLPLHFAKIKKGNWDCGEEAEDEDGRKADRYTEKRKKSAKRKGGIGFWLQYTYAAVDRVLCTDFVSCAGWDHFLS